MALELKIDYLIHYSPEIPLFVTVYRPMLPWEKWPVRKTVEYGELTLVSELCYGAEDTKKFSEGISFVVSDYTDATESARKLALELDLIS